MQGDRWLWFGDGSELPFIVHKKVKHIGMPGKFTHHFITEPTHIFRKQFNLKINSRYDGKYLFLQFEDDMVEMLDSKPYKTRIVIKCNPFDDDTEITTLYTLNKEKIKTLRTLLKSKEYALMEEEERRKDTGELYERTIKQKVEVINQINKTRVGNYNVAIEEKNEEVI